MSLLTILSFKFGSLTKLPEKFAPETLTMQKHKNTHFLTIVRIVTTMDETFGVLWKGEMNLIFFF